MRGCGTGAWYPKSMGRSTRKRAPGPENTAIECHRDVRGYFRDRVVLALQTRDVTASDEVEVYLVQLLAAYAQPGASEQDATLVELQTQANTRRGRARCETLRELGDRALYLSGFFEPALERRGLSRHYYAHMGGRAYTSAGDLSARSDRAADRARSPVLCELGQRFDTFAEVIDEVREGTALRTDDDVGDLLERYEQTHSPAIRTRLARRGIVPNWSTPRDGTGSA